MNTASPCSCIPVHTSSYINSNQNHSVDASLERLTIQELCPISRNAASQRQREGGVWYHHLFISSRWFRVTVGYAKWKHFEPPWLCICPLVKLLTDLHYTLSSSFVKCKYTRVSLLTSKLPKYQRIERNSFFQHWPQRLMWTVFRCSVRVTITSRVTLKNIKVPYLNHKGAARFCQLTTLSDSDSVLPQEVQHFLRTFTKHTHTNEQEKNPFKVSERSVPVRFQSRSQYEKYDYLMFGYFLAFWNIIFWIECWNFIYCRRRFFTRPEPFPRIVWFEWLRWPKCWSCIPVY